MKLETTISPPNSMILVMDFQSGKVPESFGGRLVASTSSCIAIGTCSEQDGDTTVVLTDEGTTYVSVGEQLIFDGPISVPSKELSIVTILNQRVLTLPISVSDVRIRVWANDAKEPTRIVVVVE